MKHLPVHLFSCVVAAVLIPLLLTTAVAQAQAAPWTVVKSPNPGAGNGLFGVASISANDVWAVGDSSTSGIEQTLTLHWNGHTWKAVKSANVPSEQNELLAVAAVSTTDVWAVGDSRTTSGAFQTLTLHWDGHKWSVVASLNPGAQLNELFGVVAVSTTDVWAVGIFALQGFSPGQTLIEHWDGTSWSVVASPNPGTQANELLGVTAVSTTDVWAVGEFNNGTGQQTLIEQWNGTSWSVVSSPAAGTSNDLRGVAIISANDIWAVGTVVISNFTQTLIEQWNGTSWNVVPSPSPSSTTNLLEGATADQSSGQAWAVGQFTAASGAEQTLTEFNP